MSIYRCSYCDNMRDGDYNTCSEDPDDALGLVCEECMAELGEPSVDQQLYKEARFRSLLNLYIREVMKPGIPVVSDSHIQLRQLYNLFGPSKVDEALEAHWRES